MITTMKVEDMNSGHFVSRDALLVSVPLQGTLGCHVCLLISVALATVNAIINFFIHFYRMCEKEAGMRGPPIH